MERESLTAKRSSGPAEAVADPDGSRALGLDGTRSLSSSVDAPLTEDGRPAKPDPEPRQVPAARPPGLSAEGPASPIRLSAPPVAGLRQAPPLPVVLEQLSIYPRRPPSPALLLGPLDLGSLDEKPMLPAARLERASQVASPDPLSVVPRAWKQALASAIRGNDRVIPAEIVRLPAPHLSNPEQIPVLLRHGAPADSPAAPPSASTRRLVDNWLRRQPTVARGSVRPVVLELEPISPSAAIPPAGRAAAKASPSRSQTDQAVSAPPPSHQPTAGFSRNSSVASPTRAGSGASQLTPLAISAPYARTSPTTSSAGSSHSAAPAAAANPSPGSHPTAALSTSRSVTAPSTEAAAGPAAASIAAPAPNSSAAPAASPAPEPAAPSAPAPAPQAAAPTPAPASTAAPSL